MCVALADLVSVRLAYQVYHMTVKVAYQAHWQSLIGEECATVPGTVQRVCIVRSFLQATQRKRYLCLPELLRVPPYKYYDLTAISRNIL